MIKLSRVDKNHRKYTLDFDVLEVLAYFRGLKRL